MVVYILTSCKSNQNNTFLLNLYLKNVDCKRTSWDFIKIGIGINDWFRRLIKKILQYPSHYLFLGKVSHGLKLHPDRIHMIYPLGCNLIIENLQTRQQEFLLGHNNKISCLTISNDGKYIASGQVTFMGFKVKKINLIFFSIQLSV